jgi:beta-phosphoglucomutase-like phosphatase (HAD superfamily)
VAGTPSVLAFDFDGVIVDSMAVHERCWSEAAVTVMGARAGNTAAQLVANLYAGNAGDAMFANTTLSDADRRALRATKDALWARRKADVPIFPRAIEVCRRLSATRFLGIATTANRAFVVSVLQRAGLLGCFGAIVTDEDVAHRKPAPDMLVSIARLAGVRASELCMTGDSPSDQLMAAAAGCRFILFSPPDRHVAAGVQADAVVADWQELGRLLETSS